MVVKRIPDTIYVEPSKGYRREWLQYLDCDRVFLTESNIRLMVDLFGSLMIMSDGMAQTISRDWLPVFDWLPINAEFAYGDDLWMKIGEKEARRYSARYGFRQHEGEHISAFCWNVRVNPV